MDIKTITKDSVIHILKDLHPLDKSARIKTETDLKKINKEDCINALGELLNGADDEIRIDAAWGLMLVDPIIGTDMVLALLEDPVSEIRWRMCGLLHDFGNSSATEALANVARNDTDGSVRHIACFALKEIGDERALLTLKWMRENDAGEDYHGHTVKKAADDAITAIVSRK